MFCSLVEADDVSPLFALIHHGDVEALRGALSKLADDTNSERGRRSRSSALAAAARARNIALQQHEITGDTLLRAAGRNGQLACAREVLSFVVDADRTGDLALAAIISPNEKFVRV